jgi:putative OPT family oligopeptide transporter
MFSGGVLSWLVLIPLIVLFGGDMILAPGTAPISELFAEGGAGAIWGTYIRYIGAGALTAGGIISLIKSLPLIIKTFGGAMKSLGNSGAVSNDRTSRDLNMLFIVISIVVLTLLIWLIPAIPVSLIGAAIIVVFGFFFATVSSRMVGLVGSSNNPVSGMAIATLLVATLILKVTGMDGFDGMCSAIAIGSVICIISAIAGDSSQDLKTGFLLGATPKKQQIGEMVGVVASALAIGGTLYLLNQAWGFGSDELAAPQATLMKLIVEGVMGGNLPWTLVFIGAFIAIIVEIIGIPVLPFAIGVYLPVQLNACIMVGGLVRLVVEKITDKKENKETTVNNGILFCSGMIAGEGIVGILLALLAVFGVDKVLNLSERLGIPAVVSNIGGIVLFAIIILTLVAFTFGKKKNNANEE